MYCLPLLLRYGVALRICGPDVLLNDDRFVVDAGGSDMNVIPKGSLHNDRCVANACGSDMYAIPKVLLNDDRSAEVATFVSPSSVLPSIAPSDETTRSNVKVFPGALRCVVPMVTAVETSRSNVKSPSGLRGDGIDDDCHSAVRVDQFFDGVYGNLNTLNVVNSSDFDKLCNSDFHRTSLASPPGLHFPSRRTSVACVDHESAFAGGDITAGRFRWPAKPQSVYWPLEHNDQFFDGVFGNLSTLNFAGGDITAGRLRLPAKPQSVNWPLEHNVQKPPGLHFPPCRTRSSCVDQMPAALLPGKSVDFAENVEIPAPLTVQLSVPFLEQDVPAFGQRPGEFCPLLATWPLIQRLTRFDR